mmetsp:Transcript_3426/g.5533  ORF Transcript_3426/g.5533 Transcript_3426/m.5533 type:complete len:156 (+) Transcript_3426:2-469(+)
MTPAVIGRLADCHGLPVGKEEEEDRVVVAQAAGGLFFEDTFGETAVAQLEEGDGEVVGAGAAEAIAAGAFERLEGVEALRSRKRSSLKLKVNQVRRQPKGQRNGFFHDRKAKAKEKSKASKAKRKPARQRQAAERKAEKDEQTERAPRKRRRKLD